ncbi:peroxidase [Beijerinckiaceae bacterium]|nr:peroxidase [Beijerinckiaceae bacterium]
MVQPVSELHDIQGILYSGYGTLGEASFLLLRVKDRGEAKEWLAAIVEEPNAEKLSYSVTSIADLKSDDHKLHRTLQVAFTAPGLRNLGLQEEVLHAFSREFYFGMAGKDAEEEGRPRRLGDVDESAPTKWEWGAPNHEPDVLVMLYAEHGALAAFQQMVIADLALGFEILDTLRAADAPENNDDQVRREPFGFIDGISQPAIDWKGERIVGIREDLEYGNLIATGEFLLGYPNEYGFYTSRPVLDPVQDPKDILRRAEDDRTRRDLGRNGTYLVFRQLEQNVPGFWQFVSKQSPEDEGVSLAEAMVGRRLSTGDPLVPASAPNTRGVGPEAIDIRQNGFTFDSDPEGLTCPFGSHIRRANPRTGDMPGGRQGFLSWILRMLGLKHDGPREDLISSSRLHRIVRRGRPYGDLIEPQAARRDDVHHNKSGIYFIALNANIARQFEFIQTAWIMNAKFNGMSGETDPLVGNRAACPVGKATDSFVLPQPNGLNRRIAGLPQFITLRGGAYFFLPSIRALRFFAQPGDRG